MQTKFDIGDEVFLTGTVESITVGTLHNTPTISYIVRAESMRSTYRVEMYEKNLILKKRGIIKDGN